MGALSSPPDFHEQVSVGLPVQAAPAGPPSRWGTPRGRPGARLARRAGAAAVRREQSLAPSSVLWTLLWLLQPPLTGICASIHLPTATARPPRTTSAGRGHANRMFGSEGGGAFPPCSICSRPLWAKAHAHTHRHVHSQACVFPPGAQWPLAAPPVWLPKGPCVPEASGSLLPPPELPRVLPSCPGQGMPSAPGSVPQAGPCSLHDFED